MKVSVDSKAVLEVVEVLEKALTTEPPFVMNIRDSVGEHQRTFDREEFLDFYVNWAIETLYDLVDTGENKKEVDHIQPCSYQIDLYREEFEAVKNSDNNQYRKNILYADLMTRMEQDFNLSMVKADQSNPANPALTLYKEISKARVWED